MFNSKTVTATWDAVMDESKKRCAALTDVLQSRNYDVSVCYGSGEFMEQLDDSTPDMILLDVDTWQRGGAIYKYFDYTKRLDDVPVLFYNAPDNFVTITGRKRNDRDRVVNRPAEPETIIEALEQI